MRRPSRSSMFVRLATQNRLVGYLRSAVARQFKGVLQPVQQELGALRKQVRALSNHMERLETTLAGISEQAARADRAAAQVKFTIRLNDKHRDTVAQLASVLDERRVIEHVQRAIAASPLETDPYPHIVVQDLLPHEFYKVLRDAIPPQPFFADRDPIKQNLKAQMDFGPTLSVRVLGFLEDVIARQAIRPAVVERFHEPLQQLYDTIFGPEFRDRANQLPQSASDGRLMLRRPGYYLAPHRDPKRSMLTCLLYLAGPRDDEAYGTQIFRVADDHEAAFTHTYYPEEHGSRCELVKMVPYRPNTMLVFLNSSGAHGATIPVDAPAGLERFTYQFYVGPGPDALNALIEDLAPERRAMWQSRKASAQTSM
ncbi:MAG: hypothetical protein HY824_15925 [Acidobacteria bacterium]|nr:hypothetical protein [Acidobacteriota bacterium]